MEAVRLAGPSTPATRRGRSAVEYSIAQFARQPRAGLVQFAHQMAQAIILLAGEIGVEGVGLDEIGARLPDTGGRYRG